MKTFRVRPGLLSLVVGIVASGLYAGTLAHGFVADDFIFLHQLRFKQPDFADSFVYFGRDWGMGADFYRPLARVYWASLHALSGEVAWGWHLAGALIYAVSAALVYLLALRLTRSNVTALLAGLLFACHPAHAETVSWLANGSDLLAGLFCLLAALFYAMFAEIGQSRRIGIYLLSLASFSAALLSKESAAGFLLVPLVYDVVFGIRRGAGATDASRASRFGLLLRRQLPFFAVAALYLWMRWGALGGIGGYAPSPEGAPSPGVFIGAYSKWLFMPVTPSGTVLWLLFLSVITVLIAGLMFWERDVPALLSGGCSSGDGEQSRRRFLMARKGIFGVCWLVLFLLPTLTTPPSVRFVYLPTIGVALVGAVLLSPLALLGNRAWNALKPAGAWSARTWQAISYLKLALVVVLLLLSERDTLLHLDAWMRAGQSSRDILTQIRDGRPEPADYTPIYAAGLPQANEEALIFRTGFPEAVQLLYGNTTIEGIAVSAFPVVEQRLNEAYFVEYQGGRIVVRDDVVVALQGRNKEIKTKSEEPFQVWDFRASDVAAPWRLLSGDGSMRVESGGLTIRVQGGGFVSPAAFTLPAPALSWFEMVAQGTPVSGGSSSAQLVVHWLVETPGGLVERASAPLPIALDGNAGTYKVKPPEMSMFLLNDVVAEIRIEIPAGIDSLVVEQARLFSLPSR
jgi:hypothetical protein